MRSEIVDLHRRLAEGAEGGGGGGGKRVLQDSTPAAAGDAQCLDPNSVAVAALDMAHSANEELARILPEIDAKANATDLAQVQTRLADVTAAVSTLLGQPVGPDEALACACAVCAEPAAGTGTVGLCEPWENSTACECSVASGAAGGAPYRQGYPVTQAQPECCRSEYLRNVTLTQMRVNLEEVYSQDEVLLKIDGQVTFEFTGWENVEQTDSSWNVLPGGIRSGDPGVDSSFQHTFATPGEFYFAS